MDNKKFLFETSWEVCNKVGGIYTVLQSKLRQAKENLGDDYILIGPWREQSKEFVEYSSPFLNKIKQVLTEKNIVCYIGYWNTASKPKVILVDFKDRYKVDALLYSLWTDFGIDSLATNYEFHEPILFSTAAGEIITLLVESGLIEDKRIIAHFHEWQCGAGILYLKKHCREVATVFTTHATVLGRSIAQNGHLPCNLATSFDADAEAHKYEVYAKHSMEKASAREADCFTAVSDIVADEASIILGKRPDKIIWNGLDIKAIQEHVASEKIPKVREKLLQVASEVVRQKIDNRALLWVTSGRYELHNKGYDLLLKSLTKLEDDLTADSPPIVVFFLVAINWHSAKDSLLGATSADMPDQQHAIGVSTHKIYNSNSKDFLKLCNELDLKNPVRKIHIVFSDAYLYGGDGVFNLTYEQIIAGCDLSIFPSFYEPWGYTPLESIACSTPTITTDLAGFGCWVTNHVKQDITGSIFVLKRKGQDEAKIVADLSEHLFAVVKKHDDDSYVAAIRKKAAQIATLADWRFFYQDYLYVYDQALKFSKLTQIALEITESDSRFVTSIYDNLVTIPRLRPLQYECILPEEISDLRQLAYNFWWSWHDDAKELFQKIDPVLWEDTQHNPVHFLNLVSTKNLQRAAKDNDYMWLYNRIIDEFNGYIHTDCNVAEFCNTTSVSHQHPIAYFCMEYGIDECLPIYSGGLGILAGDYLKAMSDLHLPSVAIGLFYKQGYFLQQVDAQGEQEALYESWDPSHIPMSPVNDDAGKAVLTSVEILGRTVYVRAWEVKVGHVNLYLLDTDVPENSAADRKITDSLYGGSREIRLMQEIVLGVGGARFLIDKLNLKPSLYHLNEGHSAFLLLERIRALCHQGITFEEAVEIVKSSSVFTTHTPVPAGNEIFSVELSKKYLENYAVSLLGISFDKLMDLAQDSNFEEPVFSMTALALRLTLNANAVSRLHGKVARSMWQMIWPGFMETEIPIDNITNGIHLVTWLGNSMKRLYEDYLPSKWCEQQHEKSIWDKVKSIKDSEVWEAHQTQKKKLLDTVKQLVISQYTLRNESKKLINATLKCLTHDTFLIGLSRRFTAYKRNNLFVLDREHLARILTNEKRPAVILVSGKAHPADSIGKGLIREIIETLRLDIFQGHIIFLEEYNIGLAKLLVQGVDMWLNTPILGREACGTSGMKVAINGGINFSTKDGWWEEAYNENIGWKIESLVSVSDLAKRADIENVYLLETLETDIIPLYYRTNRFNFSPEWIAKMKASISLIACNYNAYRMMKDYINNLYSPVILRKRELMGSNCTVLKTIIAWQHDLIERFNTVKIKAIFVNGVKDGKITSHGLLRVKLLLYIGKMNPNELQVEFVLLKDHNESKLAPEPVIIHLQGFKSESREEGVYNYLAEYQIEDPGFYLYGVRVLPYNPILFRQQDVRVVYWG